MQPTVPDRYVPVGGTLDNGQHELLNPRHRSSDTARRATQRSKQRASSRTRLDLDSADVRAGPSRIPERYRSPDRAFSLRLRCPMTALIWVGVLPGDAEAMAGHRIACGRA
jgi:hypothetical protein